MNADERALRDAFLSELWAPCPEWKGHPGPPREDRRLPCDSCGGRFTVAGLARHIRSAHGEPVAS